MSLVIEKGIHPTIEKIAKELNIENWTENKSDGFVHYGHFCLFDFTIKYSYEDWSKIPIALFRQGSEEEIYLKTDERMLISKAILDIVKNEQEKELLELDTARRKSRELLEKLSW